jgi:2-oxoisovalerate dehydrogenase E1 component
MPTGAGTGAGPFHSQSNEAWFFHTPGLKIAYPAFPYDAKGLLLTAFEDPNPVMFFEHKYLYRTIEQEIPDDYYTIPFGKASVVREGKNISVITYGLGVHWALEIVNQYPELDLEIIDLRTLIPLDKETIYNSVKKTGKVFVLNEDTLTGSISGEIATLISEYCFEYLDAPVFREGSLDTPVPMNKELEDNFLPKKRFVEKLFKLHQY